MIITLSTLGVCSSREAHQIYQLISSDCGVKSRKDEDEQQALKQGIPNEPNEPLAREPSDQAMQLESVRRPPSRSPVVPKTRFLWAQPIQDLRL